MIPLTTIPSEVFHQLEPTPRTHFKLYFYAAIIHVLHQLSEIFESQEAVFEQFPFLYGYINELAAYGLDGRTTLEARSWWQAATHEWEQNTSASIDGETLYLPLRALQMSLNLSHTAMTLWFTIGLVEEDVRFGILFEALHGVPGQHRPTVGLLDAWWRGTSEAENVRTLLPLLQNTGLIQVINPDATRIDWALQPAPLLWDILRQNHAEALRGRLPAWIVHRPPTDLTATADLILPADMQGMLSHLPPLLKSGEIRTLIVRGQRHNGRKTLIGALARELGYGLLMLQRPQAASEPVKAQKSEVDEPLLGVLATLLKSVPVLTYDLIPGETVQLPSFNGYDGFVGVAMNNQGGLADVENSFTLTLPIPDASARQQHWLQGFNGLPVENLEAFSRRYRMTGGGIRQAAKLAHTYASLNGRVVITADDIHQATHALNRQRLDRLTTHVPAATDWGVLAVGAETLQELHHLVSRCHHRERLHEAVSPTLGAQMNTGVRALFTGPSGTGKTLAARVIASELKMDVYRLDLSTVVNKYIGETEKNLNEIFSRAEELDVILLIDEGDALMTQRTNVQSSNDRYANLETNYLLQRLEAYEGIVIITTNASDRIDSAFQRRMDVTVEFRPPDATERWAILMLHLPVNHRVDDLLLREIASRCILTGGQIRNIVLHASMLALDGGDSITSEHLDAAVRREYRKTGAVCPLRPFSDKSTSVTTSRNHRRAD